MTKYRLLKDKITGERVILENRGDHGQFTTRELDNPEKYALLRKRAITNMRRKARDEAMRSIGMVKVKGALGGVYWE